MVKKRDGQIIPFDQSRITQAILKAMNAAGEGGENEQERLKSAERVSDKVVKELLRKYPSDYVLGIEEIQDVVEAALMILDYTLTAKKYVLYRRERALLREKKKEIPEQVKRLVAGSKKYFKNPLAEFVFYRSYSRWIEKEGRRETWIEAVQRYMDFMKESLGDKLTEQEYKEIHDAILKQQIMPSMRLLWSAGKAAKESNVCAYNCSFIAPAKLQDFGEIMYLSMCGSGVGFSVEQHNVQQLPQIKPQTGKKLSTYVVEDSKIGWANAFVLALSTWFNGKDIDFDYSKVRPAGSRLKTMGGKSSGPGPLRELMEFSRIKILARQGRRLNPIDVHDIICKIGDIVVAGGVRRSALLSLSDLDDQEMRLAKSGQFYLTEPQRSMANNSVAYNTKPPATQFLDEWIALAKNGTGERGIFNRGGLQKQLPDRRWKVFKKDAATSGINPCVTGDTLIYVADGRGHIPIRQLAEEGKDAPVFCRTDHGGLSVRYMRNPRITGYNEPVYKLTLDDRSTIKATANHKFLLKTGEYKQLKDLKSGDSLAIITKFAASINKDVFHTANSRSQDYWWVNTGKGNNIGEHRLIAAFHRNTKIPKGCIVHHKDRDAKNNSPENLEILSKEDHDALHSNLIEGDHNPMRRARYEWNERRWAEYKLKHSANNRAEKNQRFSGVTHEELKQHALRLTKALGQRFSHSDWVEYAKKNNLPQSFSKWRRDHLGGVLGVAKWAACHLSLEYVDADPRSLEAYKKYTAEGYDCEIIDGRLMIVKRCEICGVVFRTTPAKREHGMCSISCGLKRVWQNAEHKQRLINSINKAYSIHRQQKREQQAKMYTELKHKLGRLPTKKEWAMVCKGNDVSTEMCRPRSPFKKYKDLQEYASTYNHRVVSVEFAGYENVYNGTVDEFHNFFVGGFQSLTRNKKPKFAYLNNLQCGEIVLKSKQFCNLTEVVVRPEDDLEILLKKIRIASILGTYQSTLTNFSYLSKEWKKNCEEERLLGVSITGQWDCPEARKAEVLQALKKKAVEINKIYAKRFGINESTAITCVKPSGTVSQLVDAASGMHPRHSRYYIRRIRISATDSLFQMMKDQKVPYYPEVGQSIELAHTYVMEFPVKAPEGAILRNDLTAIQQLEHWKLVKENFTEHNPSVTVSVGNNEWIKVADWLYGNWDIIGGLSFLPREEHVYALAPYEEISEERYKKMAVDYPEIDFSQIILYEKEDETEGAKELACVGGVCEI